VYKEILVTCCKALLEHSYEGFQENDRIRVNQMSQSVKETAKLHSSAAQQNLQNNLPGEGGGRQRERELVGSGGS
jgi:hypothetical protein